MSTKIMVTGPFHLSAAERFEALGYQLEYFKARDLLSEEKLIEALQGKHAYIHGGDEIVTERALESTDVLEVIAYLGTGPETFINIAAATRKGIAVASTPGANRQGVAEITIGLMLAAWRKIPYLNERTKSGQWRIGEQLRNLQGKTLGIIGMGAIGQRVAEIGYFGFDLRIVYFSRSRKREIEEKTSAELVSLDELLQLSDVVSVHCSCNPQHKTTTADLIGARELALMKKSAILINAARAPIVNGNALYKALSEQRITAAAFDGYYTEPEIPSAENDEIGLLRLPNDVFIITPHIGWFTKESDIEASKIAAETVINILNKRPSPNTVNIFD